MNGTSKRPKPPIPEPYSNMKEWLTALAKQGKAPREMRDLTGCHKSYAFKIHKKVTEALREKEGAEEAVVEVEEVTVERAEIPVPALEKPPVEKPVVPPEVVPAIVEAKLTPEQCTSLFKSVNDLFPEKYRRDQEAMEVLGQLWVNPLNRALSKVTEGNEDFAIAVVGTIIVFSPSIIGTFQDWRKSRAKVKPD